MTAITFPGLGITLDPSPVVFTIFGKSIYWYGLIIACGMLCGWYLMTRLSGSFGFTADDVIDILISCIPIGVIGARAYYCVFYWELFKDNPISVIEIWNGGLAIYGGVIFGILGLLGYCRIKKKSPGAALDLASYGVLVGQIFGRWGNFFNREAHGCETTLPWRMGLYENGTLAYYHPTFLYESLWNLVGLVILLKFRKKRKYDGQIFAGYLFWYGLGRVWIEGLRTDSLYLFNTSIRVSQLLAGLCVLGAGGFLLWKYKHPAANEKKTVISEEVSEPAESEEKEPMKTALVIMAAGIGSRFGQGIKQLTPVGPNGELIIDFSIYDALEAGFNQIVFVIRRELEPQMRELIGDALAAKIGEENVCYVYQEKENVPDGFDGAALAAGRAKPWGTGQAVLSCRGSVKVPFAVINADDYYGKQAFRLVHDYLVEHAGEENRCCMAGFVLKNTLSDYGTVTRGVCAVNEEGYLTDVVETFDIRKTETGAEAADGTVLDTSVPVSMNFWGFPPQFLDCLEEGFRDFLSTGNVEKGEYLLPVMVDHQIKAGAITVQCLTTPDTWFGVTYAQDRPLVEASIRELIAQGVYPEALR